MNEEQSPTVTVKLLAKPGQFRKKNPSDCALICVNM